MHPLVDSMRRRTLPCALALMFCASEASALFIVNQPWLRPAPSGQSTEVYMNLTSTDGATLVAVHTDEAAAISVRGSDKDAGNALPLALPAGTVVALAPAGIRLAMSKLVRGARLGDRLALTLTIEAADGSRQDIPVHAEVRLRSPVDDELRAHRPHSH
jgi:copper(I)-binding protein